MDPRDFLIFLPLLAVAFLAGVVICAPQDDDDFDNDDNEHGV